MDARTRLLMFKMVNSGVLEKINGCISTGKESVVFHADGGRWVCVRVCVGVCLCVRGCQCVCPAPRLEEQPEAVVPDEVVLKVFKTTLNEFKNRDRYIKDDYRFKERFSKLNPRKVIRLWAEKEMHNLARYSPLPPLAWRTARTSWTLLTRVVVVAVVQDEEGGDPLSRGGAAPETHPSHVLHRQGPRPRPQAQGRGAGQRGHEEGLLPGSLCR